MTNGLSFENSKYATTANGRINSAAGKIKPLKNRKNATEKNIYVRALLTSVKITDQKHAYKTLRNIIDPQYVDMLYCDELFPVNQ
jgi:hypothetical protein